MLSPCCPGRYTHFWKFSGAVRPRTELSGPPDGAVRAPDELSGGAGGLAIFWVSGPLMVVLHIFGFRRVGLRHTGVRICGFRRIGRHHMGSRGMGSRRIESRGRHASAQLAVVELHIIPLERGARARAKVRKVVVGNQWARARMRAMWRGRGPRMWARARLRLGFEVWEREGKGCS